MYPKNVEYAKNILKGEVRKMVKWIYQNVFKFDVTQMPKIWLKPNKTTEWSKNWCENYFKPWKQLRLHFYFIQVFKLQDNGEQVNLSWHA